MQSYISLKPHLKVWGSWIAGPPIQEIAIKRGAKNGKLFLDGVSRIHYGALCIAGVCMSASMIARLILVDDYTAGLVVWTYHLGINTAQYQCSVIYYD